MTANHHSSTIEAARLASPDLGRDHITGVAQAAGVATDIDRRHVRSVTHPELASVDLAPAHMGTDTHAVLGGGDNLPPTSTRPEPTDRASAASISDPGHTRHDDHLPIAGAGLLALAAATLDDTERVRIAMENRLRAMRQDQLDQTPNYMTFEGMLEALQAAEHMATLELKRALRKHPLGAWVKSTIGIGEKQGARLLAAIDDPYWNHLDNRPRRGPAELWAYCGYAPGQKRQKGVKSNWNAQAKMRARLCAESCIKQMHSPYRAVYDRARIAWAGRDTSDMHKHNHALRCVAKAILRDLWIAGKAAS